MRSGSGPSTPTGVSAVVHVVFVLSGISALLYQIVWQRALMMIYGTNIESVAMVVSAFLLGLGLGSLAGGAVSRQHAVPLVPLFALAELIIGLYGVVSLRLFHWVGSYTLQAGALQTGILAFALVFVPTLFMGGTLPLLVAYRVRVTTHVGHSVAFLYFANTLGGALGAFAATYVVLNRFGLTGSTRVAALLNLASAGAVLVAWALRRERR